MRGKGVLGQLSVVFLFLGLLLVAWGYGDYSHSRQHPANKLPRTVLRIVPGWSLIIMGWTGLVARRPTTTGEPDSD